MSIDTDCILSLTHVSKSFPGVQALDDVSIQIKRGKVHALVGENGAGKSTLIKILAGIYKADDGTVVLEGRQVDIRTPSEAQRKGISVVHQDLKLSEPLSVTENIYLGQLLYTRAGLVDWRGMRQRAETMVENLGIDVDVNEPVETLSVAKKQIVEICRAINYNCKVLILDEPSATLTEKELNLLFNIIRRLRQEGVTIIYISHRLEEIFNLADDVTVLRDGKCINTLLVSEVTRDKLISMMVGRTLNQEYPKNFYQPGEVVLEVKNLNRKGILKNINLSIKKGEVFGIAGLVGSGRTELVRAILGIDPIDSGTILLHGNPVKHKTFQDAIKNHIGLVPEERKIQGLVQELSVRENITLVSIQKIIKNGILRKYLERKFATEYVKKLNIQTSGIDTEVQYLSGGNQQKVVLAKWLMQECEIIFLDEPTRGIDVGAKREIYKLIDNLVANGKTVIIVSSELAEVLGMSDNIAVMHGGEIVGMLDRAEATQEKIISLCV